MGNRRGIVDWPGVERVLAEIQRLSPTFWDMNVLIGGGACLFYRQLLAKANDSDFPVPCFTNEEEEAWLSKAIDTIGTPRDEIALELGIQPTEDGRCVVSDVWIDSPNVALSFDGKQAFATSLGADTLNHTLKFRVASPCLLLKEKRILLQKDRPRPQDYLHEKVLSQMCKYLLCRFIEARPIERKFVVSWRRLADDIKSVAPDILEDPLLRPRLHAAATTLENDPMGRSLFHWVKHKVPNPAADLGG